MGLFIDTKHTSYLLDKNAVNLTMIAIQFAHELSGIEGCMKQFHFEQFYEYWG